MNGGGCVDAFSCEEKCFHCMLIVHSLIYELILYKSFDFHEEC
jgi:hypothetical protein